MNVYQVGKCPRCGKAFVTPYDGGKIDTDTVMVHGIQNCLDACAMVESKMKFSEVAEKFCGYCGNLMPCGCSNSSPQHSNMK